MTEPDATGPFPATIDPHDAPPHTGQVVRRVLLGHNIVIDAVPLEYSIERLTCAIASRLDAVMVG